ncbi:MAG TPA: lipopolysaccharide biosynthesis protein, partial [Polyangiaceae bacterium]|nr:lipopolysaccharide biosynthesis protein [Polyangiaceae bacterium]
WLVFRAVGSLVSLATLLRVLAALAVALTLGRFLPYAGKLFTLVYAALVALVYVATLVISRELGKEDLALVNRVLRRRKA